MKKVTMDEFNAIIAATSEALMRNQAEHWALPQFGGDPKIAYRTLEMSMNVNEVCMQMPSQSLQDEILDVVLKQFGMTIDDAPDHVRNTIMSKALPTMAQMGAYLDNL